MQGNFRWKILQSKRDRCPKISKNERNCSFFVNNHRFCVFNMVIDLIKILLKILRFFLIIEFLSKEKNETKRKKKFATFAQNGMKCVKIDVFGRLTSMRNRL